VNTNWKLSEYHFVFPGSVLWRVTPEGVEVQGGGLIPASQAALERAKQFAEQFGSAIAGASQKTDVPVELILACCLTEAGDKDPARSIRYEPGYISDSATPNRISIGLGQLLISTARTAMKNPNIDRHWLFNPNNNCLACASYIAQQKNLTRFDPVCVACAYNAGGLYENKSERNRWRLRQFPIGTSKHADRFCENFAAALKVAETHPVLRQAKRFKEIL